MPHPVFLVLLMFSCYCQTLIPLSSKTRLRPLDYVLPSIRQHSWNKTDKFLNCQPEVQEAKGHATPSPLTRNMKNTSRTGLVLFSYFLTELVRSPARAGPSGKDFTEWLFGQSKAIFVFQPPVLSLGTENNSSSDFSQIWGAIVWTWISQSFFTLGRRKQNKTKHGQNSSHTADHRTETINIFHVQMKDDM